MNKIFRTFSAVLAVFAAATLFFSCNDKAAKNGDEAQGTAKTSTADLSYAFGVSVGASIEETGLDIDFEEFQKAFIASFSGKETRMSPDEANNAIQTALYDLMLKEAADNAAKGEAFLAKNAKKKGVTTTASGLQYEVLTQGAGVKPAVSDVVKVDYEGTLIDGTVFDSSIERGEPVSFPLDRVIPAWTEGLQLMNVGSTCKLYVPAQLAYGEQGAGPSIPPNSTLIFTVTLLSIEPPVEEAPVIDEELELNF